MADGTMDKSLSLPFDIEIDITLMHPSEFRMEMESAIEDAVETAEDIIVRMQMMEPERMVEQVENSYANHGQNKYIHHFACMA